MILKVDGKACEKALQFALICHPFIMTKYPYKHIDLKRNSLSQPKYTGIVFKLTLQLSYSHSTNKKFGKFWYIFVEFVWY